MAENKLKEFSDLPEAVQDYLLDPVVLTRVSGLVEKFELGNKGLKEIMHEVEAMVCFKHEIVNLPVFLTSLFSLSEDKAKNLAIEIVGQVILPLAQFRKGDAELLKQWGGNPAAFANIPKLEVPYQTPEEFVESALKDWNAEDPDRVLHSRLIFILVAFLKNERDLEETKSALARPTKVGGMNFPSEVVEKILSLLNERKESEGFVFDPTAKKAVEVIKPPVRIVSDIKPFVPPMPQVKKPVIDSSRGVQNDKKVDSIAPPPFPPKPQPVVRPESKVKPVPPPPLPPPPIRPVITDIKPPPPSPPPPPQPKPPVAPKVEEKTTEVILEPQKISPPVKPIISATKKDSFNLHEPQDEKEISQAAAVLKEKAPVVKAKTPLDQAVDNLVEVCDLRFVDEDLKKRFALAVDSRLRDVRDAFETRDLLERPPDQGGLGWSGAALTKVMEKLEQIVFEQKALWQDEIIKEKKVSKEVEEKKRQVVEQALAKEKAAKIKAKPLPVPITPVMSSGSVEPSGRPKMDDVAFTRKLSGPVEELQNMSLEEFRRLSRHPEEAVTKISDKISLLEEQGISQKISGIKAWRASAVNRLYLDMNKQALMTGKKITEIIADRTAAGQETLTVEEAQVINKLNGGLRF
ncbi:MAG: Periplasmic protein TolA, links inner and outer membrane [Candidatus Uhrbacteria bacterium GW2011_GWE2_45_35]|uniref:Periplasmic protein TolA, links inner and outer membrane n=3 Tax=Candidatus Uhriibacteriota TaxID=1752732 RepID=A0A0G1ML72_9BACT|nr:MAG: Periplasmic protein TolA, links inner and outer membrane [Candidatus Uhrbacteria bacterium GW2011_GWE2_45_35]